MTNAVTEPHERPENPAAAIALLTGLLLCIPGIGLIAIIAGILGIHRSRVAGTGRRPATFGLVLGVINLMWWTALIIGAVQTSQTNRRSQPAVDASRQFIRLLGMGNVAAARAMCEPSVEDAQLIAGSQQLQSWGSLGTIEDRYGGNLHSMDDIEVHVKLPYQPADKIFIGHWKTVQNSPRLMSFTFTDPPTTQPAK